MKNRKGFTLIELLVVTLLLGIGLVGVAGMFTAGLMSNRKSANITIAANRAEQEVERLRDTGYSGLTTLDSYHFPTPRYTIPSTTRVNFAVPELPQGTGHIDIDFDSHAKQINPSTGSMYKNLIRARVVISWEGSRQLRGSYSISTLLANRP